MPARPAVPACLCLSDKVQTMFGAFAAVAVLYAMIYRCDRGQFSARFNNYNDAEVKPLASLYEIWDKNAALLNPVLKIAGQQAPSAGCLHAVLSLLKADNLPSLVQTCLTDKSPVPAELTQSTVLNLPSIDGSYAAGFSLQRSKSQARGNELTDLQILRQNFHAGHKVLLCPGLSLKPRDLKELVKAQADYICALPAGRGRQAASRITAADVSAYVQHYLATDAGKPLCLNSQLQISGIFLKQQDASGKEVSESIVQCEFSAFMYELVTLRAEDEIGDDDEDDISRWEAQAVAEDIIDKMSVWQEEGCAQSVLYISRGKQSATFISSLPCVHQAEYLHMLHSLLRPVLDTDRAQLTLCPLLPDYLVPVQARWNMLNVLKQADVLAATIINQITNRLKKAGKAPWNLGPEEVHKVMTEHTEQAVATALHFMQAYYSGNKYLQADPVLQNKQWV